MEALINSSTFFQGDLEGFEVNKSVSLPNKKTGLRIDAEATSNRLVEGKLLGLHQIYMFATTILMPNSYHQADSNVRRVIGQWQVSVSSSHREFVLTVNKLFMTYSLRVFLDCPICSILISGEVKLWWAQVFSSESTAPYSSL